MLVESGLSVVVFTFACLILCRVEVDDKNKLGGLHYFLL